MLNVSAIPLTDISPIWDDGFLSLSKNLLSAVTLDDFIKKLNRIQPCFRQVDRVNLILNLGTREEPPRMRATPPYHSPRSSGWPEQGTRYGSASLTPDG